MGTNFYFTPAEGAVAAYGELHLGKRSGGWEFSFHGYVEQGGRRRIEINSCGLTLEVDVSPLVIKSYADWQQLLRSTPGKIRDEYGTAYSVADFEAEIAAHSPGKTWGDGRLLQNHYDEMVKQQAIYGKVDPERNWKDAEGFSFSAYDFC